MQGISIGPFPSSFKSEETEENYCIKLRQFLNYSKMTSEELRDLAMKKSDKSEQLSEVEIVILKYTKEKGRQVAGAKISGSRVLMFRIAIKKFLS